MLRSLSSVIIAFFAPKCIEQKHILPKIKSWENRQSESGAVFSFHRAARVCEREKGSEWKIGEEFFSPKTEREILPNGEVKK
jgi:hypothetical protein